MSNDEDLEDLPGVGPATADKLVDAGYDSYKSIAVASPSELDHKADIGESTANDIVKAAQEAADIGGFETGADIAERRSEIGKLQWLVPEVDDLLGGGVETQSITETYGEFGAGKSQVTLQLSVNVQLPKEHGGLEGSAIFIDTEDTFRPNRIEDMVRGLEDDVMQSFMDQEGVNGSPDDEDAVSELVEIVLENINVAKAHNSNHQIMLVEKAENIAREAKENDDEHPVRLLVVDSLTNHFRSEYVGRGQLAERQQKLNKHMHDVLRFTSLFNSAGLVTNQVQSDPDSYFGDPTKAIGGNIVGHTSTTRMYLRKSKENRRVVKLVDSPDLPEGEAVMRITERGLKPE